ncbi:hypothetical protein BT63DRAFT_432718 [Microthyrium microscopicum]|uniref:C2H2-type domain-containing protein n=1 Tax=Microthyrium microscopicum TaxID=703497 RepID=A0A6A6UFX2_9PEZI|nr:hypothetical protein BT63DRAFT_432718 [Microthyrium microscopicum]
MSTARRTSEDSGQGNAPSNPEVTAQTTPTFPPPKTDKPRPHGCLTCGRFFARLEHLKRHERSHTKEKPFECNVCKRCFARRDLLLRHQQKLHQTGHTTRPRNGRRNSGQLITPQAQARRRGSMASANGPPAMRPRANTIGHIDHNMLAHNSTRNQGMPHIYGHQSSQSIGTIPDYMSIPMEFPTFAATHSHAHLPRIETSGLGLDLDGGLRTAPVMTNGLFGMDRMWSSSTINPAQLHYSGEPAPGSPYTTSFPPLGSADMDNGFEWSAMGEDFLSRGANDVALDQSSPSAFSAGSASAFSEMMIDGSNNPPVTSGQIWPSNPMVTAAQFAHDPISSAVFGELMTPLMSPGTMSSGDVHEQSGVDNYMSLNGHIHMSPVPGNPSLTQFFPSLTYGSDDTSVTSAHGSGQSSSMMTSSIDSITDATRQALLSSLSQSSGFGHSSRRISQSSTTSPLSPGSTIRQTQPSINLPSTYDLQRYVHSYIAYFHPHMPFIHLPTLNFDTPAFTNNLYSNPSYGRGLLGGGSCLILAMAAIGASYEFEHQVADELFENSKALIQLYLESSRKNTPSKMNLPGSGISKTPLWLVQATLLNIVFGHQCGEQKSAEIATTHCASLVSLAKAAELEQPDLDISEEENRAYLVRCGLSSDRDIKIEGGEHPHSWTRQTAPESREEFSVWYRWKSMEERKRTMFSVFIISSLLVTAYNQQPKISNSEIHLGLPCEENLWAADTPFMWNQLGGMANAQSKGIPFTDALNWLLSANQRSRQHQRTSSHHTLGSPRSIGQESELRPSTFGCYILINAIHVEIWEARQRHQGRQWNIEQTEQLRANIEPALREWQAAWASNPIHVLGRPNPHGPLPADSIPLLDLAYVRLFVNLGRSKEAFWAWDFELMAQELATGHDVVPHATEDSDMSANVKRLKIEEDDHHSSASTTSSADAANSSKRERHLRKAAFYAADSLTMAHKLGSTFAEFTSRELPIQAAMCTFDCAQVLAEWLATVQERVGRYLHAILGREEIDTSMPEVFMTLESDDIVLLGKVNDILSVAQSKIVQDLQAKGQSHESVLMPMKSGGYGYQLLMSMAYLLDRAAVWGITKVMAEALRIHATKIKHRAEVSVLPELADVKMDTPQDS